MYICIALKLYDMLVALTDNWVSIFSEKLNLYRYTKKLDKYYISNPKNPGITSVSFVKLLLIKCNSTLFCNIPNTCYLLSV